MNEYEFPAHRHEHDFKKIDELFARVQGFPSKPELTNYPLHIVNPPYTFWDSQETGTDHNKGRKPTKKNVVCP